MPRKSPTTWSSYLPSLLFLALLLAAFALRNGHFADIGLFRDEPSAFTDSLHPLLAYLFPDTFRPVEINGIFYHVYVQRYWQNFCFTFLSHPGPDAFRFSSVICGLLSIWTTYLLGIRLKSRALGLIAAAFLTINGLHLYYSCFLRFHMFNVLAVCLLFLFTLRLGQRRSLGNWLAYIALSLICIYSTLTSLLVLPVTWFCLWQQQRRLAPILLLALTAALAYLPFPLIDPAAASRIAWYPPADAATCLAVLTSLFGIRDHLLGPLTLLTFASLALLLLLGLLSSMRSKTMLSPSLSSSRPQAWVALWFLFPLVALVLASWTVQPVLITRTALFVQPALALLIALGLTELPRRPATVALVLALSLVVVPTLLKECRHSVAYEWNVPLSAESFSSKETPYRYYSDALPYGIHAPIIPDPAAYLRERAQQR